MPMARTKDDREQQQQLLCDVCVCLCVCLFVCLCVRCLLTKMQTTTRENAKEEEEAEAEAEQQRQSHLLFRISKTMQILMGVSVCECVFFSIFFLFFLSSLPLKMKTTPCETSDHFCSLAKISACPNLFTIVCCACVCVCEKHSHICIEKFYSSVCLYNVFN